jgi:hypothetical protein
MRQPHPTRQPPSHPGTHPRVSHTITPASATRQGFTRRRLHPELRPSHAPHASRHTHSTASTRWRSQPREQAASLPHAGPLEPARLPTRLLVRYPTHSMISIRPLRARSCPKKAKPPLVRRPHRGTPAPHTAPHAPAGWAPSLLDSDPPHIRVRPAFPHHSGVLTTPACRYGAPDTADPPHLTAGTTTPNTHVRSTLPSHTQARHTPLQLPDPGHEYHPNRQGPEPGPSLP